MKRDDKLMAKILVAVEADDWQPGKQIDVEGYEERAIAYHVALLDQAGVLVAADCTDFDDAIPQAMPIEITNLGHDFLRAARDDTLWGNAKKQLQQAIPMLALEALRLFISA